MFKRQKQLLAQAKREHYAAVETKEAASKLMHDQRQSFLGEPLNLLYPFAAGALVCASQLKNEAKGLQRIPFLNIAKTGIGLWATIERVQKLVKNRAAGKSPPTS